MVVCVPYTLTHILKHSKIHRKGMIHDLWSHRGATNTPDTLSTCVLREAAIHRDPVIHVIFTMEQTVSPLVIWRGYTQKATRAGGG